MRFATVGRDSRSVGLDLEVRHAPEVIDVAGDYRHAVREGCCRDPDVVCTDELSDPSKVPVGAAVLPGDVWCHRQEKERCEESLPALPVCHRHAGGEFPGDDRRQIQACIVQALEEFDRAPLRSAQVFTFEARFASQPSPIWVLQSKKSVSQPATPQVPPLQEGVPLSTLHARVH